MLSISGWVVAASMALIAFNEPGNTGVPNLDETSRVALVVGD